MSSITSNSGHSIDKQEHQNTASRLQSMDSLLLDGSVTSFTVQDIQDSIVQQTLSETILLQNANFDSNIFDDVNLDLESNSNTNDPEPKAGQSLEQVSLLDNINLQLLKQVRASNEIVSNSSDPLVTSTTTVCTYDDGQTNSKSILDFKYFGKTSDSSMDDSFQANPQSGRSIATVYPECPVNTDSDNDCGDAKDLQNSSTQNKLIQNNRLTKPTTFSNEKVYLSASTLPANVETLSLANMKVGTHNVNAVINNSTNKTNKQQVSTTPSQIQQPQLILIKDNKELINETAVCKADMPQHKTVTGCNTKTTVTSSPVVKEVKGSNNIASSTSATSGESNQFTDADSNSGTPSSKAFVPCKVCGDKASGYHYGVTSCEGCKGFFRRSIQKQIEYRCLRDGKCLIIRLNRNRCQYCRFKKCLAVGMSRDSVRYGRVPKKSKEKERLDEKSNGVTQAEADQSSTVDVDSKDLQLYDTILTISQAHHANCSYTGDKIKGLLKKPIFEIKTSDDCSSSHDVGSVSESLETKRIELWENLALLITPCIQRVVEFAKRIPGFTDLTQDDQLILIKLGFFEVWLVHISKTADCAENTLTFADGSFLSRKQLELMFDHDFVASIFHLMSGINNLNLNDTEIGLFAAIILLQSDRPQIYDVKAINKNQEIIVEALKVQISRYHNDDLQTFQKLMIKINELRGLGSSHALHLQWYRSNWSRLKLPPLFAEIFDIPKSSSFGTSAAHASSTVQPSSSSSPLIKIEPASPSESKLTLPLDNSNLIG